MISTLAVNVSGAIEWSVGSADWEREFFRLLSSRERWLSYQRHY
jgi:hypothetical protein